MYFVATKFAAVVNRGQKVFSVAAVDILPSLTEVGWVQTESGFSQGLIPTGHVGTNKRKWNLSFLVGVFTLHASIATSMDLRTKCARVQCGLGSREVISVEDIKML